MCVCVGGGAIFKHAVSKDGVLRVVLIGIRYGSNMLPNSLNILQIKFKSKRL